MGPLDVGLTHGEGTEMQVSATHIFLTGHNDCDSTPSPLCGKLTKLDASDGGMVFSKGYASRRAQRVRHELYQERVLASPSPPTAAPSSRAAQASRTVMA